MAKLSYWFHAGLISYLILKRKALLKYGNFLVYLHFRFTPSSATEDIFREMVLEFLRKRIRKNDQNAYTIWAKMLEIGVTKLGISMVNPTAKLEDNNHAVN